MEETRQYSTNSIPSSPGSSSLPSPPSSPQLLAQGHVQSQAHHHHDGHLNAHNETYESLPASPLSIASSFPSGASSYMFSHSASSSPPYIAPHLLGEYNTSHSRQHTDSDNDPLGLVIPSLSLPPAVSSAGGDSTRQSESDRGRIHRHHRGHLHHQSPYGETLGTVELFVFGRKGAGKTAIANTLVEGNDDVISSAGWDHNVLIASTAWKDARARHGVRNVKIVEVEGFNDDDQQASEVLQPLLRILRERFEKVATGLSSDLPASQPIMDMLASSSSPLPSALIFLLSSPPTPLELTLLSLISTHIPTITLPPYPTSISSVPSYASMPSHVLNSTSTILLGPSQSPRAPFASGAAFRPRNTLELRNGIFRNPGVLKSLRVASAERFEHWREIRKAVGEMGTSSYILPTVPSLQEEREKGKRAEKDRRKKLEWELRLSRDVASAFHSQSPSMERGGTVGRRSKVKAEEEEKPSLEELEEGHSQSQDEAKELKRAIEREREDEDRWNGHENLDAPDPLHLPTLFRLSAALLGAFGKRLVSSLVQPPVQHYPHSHGDLKHDRLDEEMHEDGWTLTKWGLAGIAFAIGYCAGKFMK